MSVFRTPSSVLLYSLAAIVIIAAMALSLMRLVVPYADDFRQQIQSAISDVAGRDVIIGDIDASWRHFKPQIELQNVSIALGDEQALEFGRVSLGVDLISSVLQRRLISNEIRLAGFELYVVESAEGRFSLAGLPASEKRVDMALYRNLAQWLARQQQVVVENGTLYLTSEKRPELLQIFSKFGVYVVNADEHHQLAAQIDMPASLGGKVELVANLNGIPLLQDDWSVDSYIKLESISVPGFAEEFIKAAANGRARDNANKVKGGVLDLEMWATVASDQTFVAQGRLAAAKLRLSDESSKKLGSELMISELSADFAVRKQQQEWAMAVAPLRIARVGASEQSLDLQLRYRDDTKARALILQTGSYRVDDMLGLVRATPWLSGEQLSALSRMNVSGDVSKTILQWRQGEDAVLSAYAEFDNFIVAPSEQLPGIGGLSGFVHYRGDHGQLVIATPDSRFTASRWFRSPLQFDSLALDLAWSKYDSGLLVEVSDITLNNADIALAGNVAMRIPVDQKASPYIDLELALERADIAKRSLYLPAKIMPAKTVQWFDRALKQGRLSAGTVRLEGLLAKFPFKDGGGAFSVDARIDQAQLEYSRGWPAIQNIGANLRVRNAGIELIADRGSAFDTKIKQARMSVTDFTVKPVAMKVIGTTQGPSADALRFVAQSPLKKRFKDALQVLSVDGESELSLRLDIPIPGKVSVFGKLAMVDNHLSVANDQFIAKNIDGTLHFDNKGLRGDAIGADIFGMRTLVDFEPVVDGDKHGIKFTGRGQGDVASYARLSGLPWLTKRAAGKSQWKAQLVVLGGKLDLSVESDLVGIVSQFPQPLAKSADEDKLFSLSTALPIGSKPIVLSYGADIQADVEIESGPNATVRLALLNVGLGKPPVKRVAGSKGIFIDGVLDKLVLDEWISASTLWVDGSQSSADLPVEVKLVADRLDVFDYLWQRVSVDAKQTNGRWHAALSGEGIRGIVETEGAAADAHITLTMDELVLSPVELKQVGQADSYDPRDLPTVNLTVKQFNYNDFDLGKVAFKTNKIKQGQHIDAIVIDAPTFSLAGAGNWIQIANTQRSSFNVVIETDDLGEMLNHFGYAADNVSGGKSAVNANVFWQGMPSDYTHDKLNGQLALSVKDISFSDIDPGAGRVFGLLSIQALPQRLSLDFSDLFKKGLQINTIEGSFSVKNGDATTDDLFMQGPAVRIDIAGRIGLAKQDYDQVMAVTPEVSSSLPLVGAAVAGPAGAGIGTAILFLHKLFNPKILHYKYQVSGPWSNPQVVLLKSANTQSEERQD